MHILITNDDGIEAPGLKALTAEHMYELNNRIRLIDVTSFPIESSDAFIGFLPAALPRTV